MKPPTPTTPTTTTTTTTEQEIIDEVESVDAIKQKGNDALKEGKYEEAVFHYSHALRLDPENYTLFSNRSFAFLKMQQYYFAMEDANNAIRINPIWPKGHFRKGEVEFATFHFSEALLSYKNALLLQPNDYIIENAILRASKELQKDLKADDQIPWLGAGIGIVLGVIIVIADFIGTNKPTLTHPILMAALTIAIAMIGYGAAKGFRFYVKCQRNAALETPPFIDDKNKEKTDESNDESNNTNAKTNERTQRYTKSQARFRYKKGKM